MLEVESISKEKGLMPLLERSLSGEHLELCGIRKYKEKIAKLLSTGKEGEESQGETSEDISESKSEINV